MKFLCSSFYEAVEDRLVSCQQRIRSEVRTDPFMASAVNQSVPCANTTFLEHYLECLESLPEDIQRNVSQLRELDLLYRAKLEQIDHLLKLYMSEKDAVLKSNYLVKIQRCLVRSQEYGDEKLQLISQIVEVAENRNHQIANDAENVDIFTRVGDESTAVRTDSPVPKIEETKPIEKLKRPRRQKATEKEEKEKENNKEKEVPKEKKSKRNENEKSEKSDSSSGIMMTHSNDTIKKAIKKKTKTSKKKKKETIQDLIDPDEPTYCLCQQVSYGEMIGCDNEECPVEWFHFSCVNLTVKPKGKWYCPDCSAERKEKNKK